MQNFNTETEFENETKIEKELKNDIIEAREIWVQSCKDNEPFELQKIYEKIYNDCVSVWKSYVHRIPENSSISKEINLYSNSKEENEELLMNEITRLKNEIMFNTYVYHQHDSDCFEHIFCDANNKLYDRVRFIQWALQNMFASEDADLNVDMDNDDDVFPEMNLEVD